MDLPLTIDSPNAVAGARKLAQLRTVSVVTATTIAIADMIGIGIFTSLGFQVGNIPTLFSVLMLWVVGGIAALCGAVSYAELAGVFPRSGGEYNFLSRTYHPAVGFVAGWISATVGFAAPIALAALAFGEYSTGAVPGSSPLLLALGVVWLIAIIQLTGVRGSAAFQNVSTFLKVALLAALIFGGLAFGTMQPISFTPTMADLQHMTSAPFAVSLVFVMYSYSGWNAATYIASEVRNPQRNVPVAMIAATLIVLTLYVAFNAVILSTTPVSALAGQVDVAQIAGRHILGDSGGRIVSSVICIGLLSSINAMTWIGSRVITTMGEDHIALRFFSPVNAKGVPVRAILSQLAIATLLLMTQSFEAVLDYIQFSLTLCSFVAVLGVIVLRFTKPDLERPYRAWGYPITPLVFLAVTAFMMYHLVTERPVQSLEGLATMLTGLVIYYLSQSQESTDDAIAPFKQR